MAADSARAGLDIHETAGDDYKAAVRSTFLWCAREHDHWMRVACVDEPSGRRLTKQELHEGLYDVLRPHLVNRGAGAPAKAGEEAK